MRGITIIGLGPGDPGMITRQAWEILTASRQIWLRTNSHPAAACLPSSIDIQSFDYLYESSENFEQVYAGIVEKVIELGNSPQGVVYAVPGDPYVAEATCPEIARRADVAGIPIKVIPGLSFLEPVFSALRIDPFSRLLLLDGLELSQAHVADFPPDTPALIAQVYSRLVAAEVKMTLNTVFPDEHPVVLVHSAGTADALIETMQLYEMDRSEHIGMQTVLYVPPMRKGSSFESFQEIVAHLRAPDGCPWDKEQTHASLRPHLMEEAYETLAAMDTGDPAKMVEEFGDLLLQIVLNAQIAGEEGDFTMAQVLQGIFDKIIRRHPHVFGDVHLEDVSGVLKNWEVLKAEERTQSQENSKGLLEGVPFSLPALSQAQEYQDRAARVGFDWKEIEGVLEKVKEEAEEIKACENFQQLEAELGDLLFTLVNLARWKKVDAESALRETNRKFKKRFERIEYGAISQNRKLTDLSVEEMETLWQAAKEPPITD